METLLKNYNESKNSIKNSNENNEKDTKQAPKYKTELCKTFQSTGKCPYGHKCLFAHGKNELIIKQQSQNYKKKPCKSFNEKGFCLYGSRCNFIHNEKKIENTIFSYYYLQLFINKNFVYDESFNFSTPLLNGRLPIFENITNGKFECEKMQISSFSKIRGKERSSSMSTNSNEESDINLDFNGNYSNDLNMNNISTIQINYFKNLVNNNLYQLNEKFVNNQNEMCA